MFTPGMYVRDKYGDVYKVLSVINPNKVAVEFGYSAEHIDTSELTEVVVITIEQLELGLYHDDVCLDDSVSINVDVYALWNYLKRFL